MLHTTYYSSPFGIFEIKGSELGVRSVQLVEVGHLPESDLPECLTDCVQQLDEYFNGTRTAFDLKLDWSGAPTFHRKVWSELLKIPYGTTTTYLAIAETLGEPKAVRAVGQANKHNPIAIIVPCHRVIAKSGELQGYFYGLDMKMDLLRLENPERYALQGSLF